MQYRNVAQGTRCEILKDAVRESQLKAESWEDHVGRLKDKIGFESRQLESLRQQADRTGDYESFAPAIKDKEADIRNLERQVGVARRNAKEWRQHIDDLEDEMAQNGCFGSV